MTYTGAPTGVLPAEHQVLQLLRAKGSSLMHGVRPDNVAALAELFTHSLMQVCVWGRRSRHALD